MSLSILSNPILLIYAYGMQVLSFSCFWLQHLTKGKKGKTFSCCVSFCTVGVTEKNTAAGSFKYWTAAFIREIQTGNFSVLKTQCIFQIASNKGGAGQPSKYLNKQASGFAIRKELTVNTVKNVSIRPESLAEDFNVFLKEYGQINSNAQLTRKRLEDD